jgi:hypothetical protein
MGRLPVSEQVGYLGDHRPGQQPAAGRGDGERRSFWRRRLLLALLSPVGLAGVAATVAGVLAAGYQPIGSGSSGGGSFPRLPTGVGIRWVNGFLVQTQDLYIPPQGGIFALGGRHAQAGAAD